MSEQEQINIPNVVPKTPKYVTVRTMCLVVLCVNIFSLAVSFVIYDRNYATKIATYDLPAKLLLIEQAAKDGKISFQQAEQVSALEIVEAKKLSDLAPSNYIVITREAVLGSHAKVIEQ
jgi:hypothetical protein